VAVEGALQKYILPEHHDDAERVDRLVTVVGSLDLKAKTAFTAIVTKQKSFMEGMQKYVEMCEANVRIYYYNVLQYKLRIQHSLECG
jgi:sister-chromatid-cohesion protein PDS5